MPAEPFDSLQQLLAGQYVLERELGRGGMGVVYLAREARLDRAVAVKVLPPELGANPGLRERFLREARTAAQLSHPNIVPIFRADEVGGFAFFTMAYIEGESLADRLRARGPLPPTEAVRVLREAAWALAYAHARGVVHRDVKPENIMIERGSNRAVVTDFGIAREQRASSLTQEGMVLGSVHYMSPEQAAGDTVDGRSDLYSLGIVGFEILAGIRPFIAEDAATVMAQQVTRQAPSLASVTPDVPRALAAVIDRCLSKRPADRYQTGEALAEALEASLQSVELVANSGPQREMVSTEQARAIWQRAAQLQAEAGSRLHERYRQLESADAPAPSGGYRLRDVELAAAEAGIGPEYVALAVAERPQGTAAVPVLLSDRDDRLFTQVLGTSDRSISRSLVIHATPRAVLEAIGRVFTTHPYSLALRDTVGGHPLDGGIVVFDVPRFTVMESSSGYSIGNMFAYRMSQIAVEQLNVVLRPVGSPADACEVTIYGDLRQGMRKNWKWNKWISGIAAGGGTAAGTVIGIGGLSLGALAVLPAALGALALGGTSLACYRALYRHCLRKNQTELEGLLAAIGGNLRAQSVFGSTGPEHPRLPSP